MPPQPVLVPPSTTTPTPSCIIAAFAGGYIAARMSGRTVSFAQAQFSESIEAGREFARCRSPSDLLQVQMRYTRSSADRILTEATKLAELSVRVASASLQPLQAHTGFTERLRS